MRRGEYEVKDRDEITRWLEKNIIRSTDAHLFTGQTPEAFKQSLLKGYIKPIVKLNSNPASSKPTNLFLKEDLNHYRIKIQRKRGN